MCFGSFRILQVKYAGLDFEPMRKQSKPLQTNVEPKERTHYALVDPEKTKAQPAPEPADDVDGSTIV